MSTEEALALTREAANLFAVLSHLQKHANLRLKLEAVPGRRGRESAARHASPDLASRTQNGTKSVPFCVSNCNGPPVRSDAQVEQDLG